MGAGDCRKSAWGIGEVTSGGKEATNEGVGKRPPWVSKSESPWGMGQQCKACPIACGVNATPCILSITDRNAQDVRKCK